MKLVFGGTTDALDFDPNEPDPVLDQLEREHVELTGNMGATPRSFEVRNEPPLDVEVVKPIALSLKRIFEASASPFKDALGDNKIPIVIRHGLTPFFPATTRPRPIWGLGYQAKLAEDAATIDFAPKTEMLEVGSVDQHLWFGLTTGGKLSTIAATENEVLQPLAGIDLPDIEIGGGVGNKLELRARIKLELLKVQAGPIGAGGVRWNLYRQDKTLVAFTPLVQTMLVSPDTKKLTFEVVTWAKVGGIFGIGTKAWIAEPKTFEVAITP